MVKVIAPCFSLSASGLLGKALFYYDTKWGARVRSPKKSFVPPGTVWEINKQWFTLANARSKSLTREQRYAWQDAYPLKCDNWRDIFMGKQIEAWNLSPANDLTWPQISVQDIGDIEFGSMMTGPWEMRAWFSKYNYTEVRKWTIGSVWWNILNDPRAPTASDPYKFSRYTGYTRTLVPGNTNYLWGGVRYFNGTFKAFFISSIA